MKEKKKFSVLFFVILFVFCMSSSAMADTITTGTVDINAGAGAEATIIGAQSGPNTAITGSSTAITGPNTAITGPSTAITGPNTAITGPSSASAEANINDITAATGPSSAEIGDVKFDLKNELAVISNGKPGFPGAAQIPGTQLIQNFGPVHKVWNVISQEELIILLKLSPEGWTMEQAKALVVRGAKSYSRKINCSLPATDKIQVFYVPPVQVQSEQKEYNDKIDKFIEESGFVKVGIISCRGNEKNDSYDVLGLAMRDTGKVGGKVLILTCLDGQLRTESDGWGVGIGGLRSSISGADNGLGSSGYGGTGYAEAGNEYVGKPFARGFACIAKNELTEIMKAKPAFSETSFEGIWFNEAGQPMFPWQKEAVGAGIVNGH